MRVHVKKAFACNICDYKTAFKNNLEKHKTTHSAKVACPVCKKQVAAMKVHMIGHEPKVPCRICHKLFRKCSLKKHMENHIRRSIRCDECEETFGSKRELRMHKLRMHFKGELFECHCGSVYGSMHRLILHQQSHAKISCEVCHVQCSSKTSLNAHWKRKHLQTHGSKREKSKFLKYYTRANANYFISLAVKTLNFNGPFICDKCGLKVFNRKAFLRHNIINHRDDTMFCDLCPQSFNQKRHLVSHLRRVHLKLRPLNCKVCEFKTFHLQSYKCHQQLHVAKTECKICHKKVADLQNHLTTHVKKFACSVCNYRTAWKKTYENHQRVHLGKSVCPICKKQVVSLNVHLKTHGPLATCQICQKKIKSMNLKAHIKRHKIQKCSDCDETFIIREDLRR